MPQTTENVTVRMPPKMGKRLKTIASGLDRSRNWLINQAVEQYIEAYDWQTDMIRERLAKSEKDGVFIPHNEVMRRLEKKMSSKRPS